MDNSESKTNSIPKPAHKPLDDMYAAYQEATPVLLKLLARFLVASWNMFMKILIFLGVMPMFRKVPWLFFVLAFVLLAVFPPLGAYFIASACAAYNGENAENDFLQDAVDTKPNFESAEDEKEALQGEAMLRVYEAGHSIETAEKVYDAMGALYDMKKAKSDALKTSK